MTYAREGRAFYSVITNKVAVEYELPIEGDLGEGSEEARQYEELLDLADMHRVGIHRSSYPLL
ncbi:MAG TPA: hypothetical protein VEW06_06375 [Xanthobacteraceae bacterium]|nr:hypothetical protein [Xanthobacteraceae bacterium]